MSNITLNIVEPGSPTPVNPATPSTGLFTHGIGSTEATIIAVAAVALLAIATIYIYIYIYRKHKRTNHATKLAQLNSSTKSKKHLTVSLFVLAFLVSIGTIAGVLKLAASAIAGEEDTDSSNSSLTVDVSSTELTIELADQPVFAVLPVDITVAEATDLGYTLTAYTEDTNLVSTTDSSNIIPMVVSEDTPVALTANTYGLSFTDPESALDEVFTSLSTDSTTPTFIADKDYLATEANDTTTIYYGFYITPDTPYGTYTGGNISVDAIPNIATVTFDANGLYFNDSEEDTENTVGYKPNIAQSPIELVTGEYLTPAPLTPVDPSTPIHYTFLGWSETEGATTPTYTNEEDILANLTLTKNESLTLYAVWHYDTVLSFNGTTSDGGEAIEQQTIAAGTTITLPHNTYTRTGSVFTGWNTVETPTPDNPGKSYADEAEFIAPEESADITLYAQWAYYTTITFDGNDETSGTMNPQTIVAGTPQNLTPNAYAKDGYVFNGWNTVQIPTTEDPGTVYADKAQYTASTIAAENVTLYAQWKQVFYMQDVATWGSTLSQGSTMEAVDKRDGKTYYVSRLADNKIWMTQNLDLDLSTSKELTSANTNITANWTPERNTIAKDDLSSSTWKYDISNPYSYDPGDVYYYSSGNTSNDTQYDSLASCQAAHSDCSMHNHAGNYYNWSAAVASNDTSGLTTNCDNAPGSICPAGWRLPVGTDNSGTAASREWNALLYAEGVASSETGNSYASGGFNKIRTAPLWLARSGSVYNGSLSNTGSRGLYWSSTVRGTSNAYLLNFNSSNVSPASYNDRSSGYPVRCIAQ